MSLLFKLEVKLRETFQSMIQNLHPFLFGKSLPDCEESCRLHTVILEQICEVEFLRKVIFKIQYILILNWISQHWIKHRRNLIVSVCYRIVYKVLIVMKNNTFCFIHLLKEIQNNDRFAKFWSCLIWFVLSK